MESTQIILKKDGGPNTGSIKKKFLSIRKMKVQLLLCLLAVSLCLGLLGAYANINTNVLVLVAIVSPPLVLAIIAYPRFGVLLLLLLAYIIMFISRLGVDFPMGTIMDGLELLLIAGLLLKQKFKPNWSVYKNLISWILLIWLIYNMLEVLNPSAASRLAWLYTVRSIAIVALTYFIFSYHLLDIRFVRLVLKIWIALSVFGALYAVKQEYIGFSSFEKKGLEDPTIRSLYFIAGHWRKFSIFSDPVAFAYNMVISSILCLCLITGPLAFWKRILLACCVLLFQITMLYSGTRGAFVLSPAGLALFSVLRYNRKVMVYVAIMGGLVGGLIVIPTSNPNLQRFQSAFWPSYDESFNVRKLNQKKIQPYILSHPLGGGLGSTGVWGKRFSPSSFLANFPPDSGYVRVAVEQGWIGLLIFCTLLFVVLRTGIINYYKIRNPELKSYCLAMTLIVFVLTLGNYPQEALVQFPISIYFYLALALINITCLLDGKINTLSV